MVLDTGLLMSHLLVFAVERVAGVQQLLLSHLQPGLQRLSLLLPLTPLVAHHDVDLVHELLQLCLTGDNPGARGTGGLKNNWFTTMQWNKCSIDPTCIYKLIVHELKSLCLIYLRHISVRSWVRFNENMLQILSTLERNHFVVKEAHQYLQLTRAEVLILIKPDASTAHILRAVM